MFIFNSDINYQEDFAKYLESIGFRFECKTAWGSDQPGFREEISKSLGLKRESSKANPFVSISHTKGFGGYIQLIDQAQKKCIGLDIELTDRVSKPIVQRVCKTMDEFNSAPSLAALWCAKEASYKSFRSLPEWGWSQQPEIISQVEICNWKTFNITKKLITEDGEMRLSHFATFEAINRQTPHKLNTLGLTFCSQNHFFALATTQDIHNS